MDGFGASLTEASSWLLSYRLDDSYRHQVLSSLFSKDGIHLNLLRQPIGATDFGLSSWSLNDSPNNLDDWNLEHFSMAKEEAFILPILREAMRQSQDNIKLIASPWTAPAWMKTLKHLYGFGGMLRPDAFDAYARYFMRYLIEMRARGFEIDAITVVNEPQYAPLHYPGMLMFPSDQIDFVGRYLGPMLKRSEFRTKIYAFDHNFDDNNVDYAEQVLNSNISNQYVAGSAFHPYCTAVLHEKMTKLHDLHPEKSVHLTEAGSGTWIGDESAQFEDQMRHLIRTPRNWGESVILWNVALDQAAGPKLPFVDPANRGLITIRSDQRNNVTFNSGFFSLGHSSKFVTRGSVRVESNQLIDQIENVAYITPDEHLVLILMNKSIKDLDIQVVWKSMRFNLLLSPKSGYTFKWKAF